MKKALCLLCFLVLLFVPLSLWAGILKGTITDTKGEPLPFATVFVKGTTNGTSANADAHYQLYLAPGTYKVHCQYMGFKQKTFDVTIKGEETIMHDFSLQEQTLEMKTVVVKANAEDPAYAIIRKAIARRTFHLSQVKSLQTSIYLKGVLRNRKMPSGKMFGISVSDGDKKEASTEMGLDTAGRGVMYLLEEHADYYAKDNKERTIIRSVRVSGNPYGLGWSEMPSIVTFYENNVQPLGGVSPRGFVSPISDNAIFYYKYKYEGEYMENGYRINKIKVIPRRDYEPLMRGYIYIVEDEWAIHSLNLLATTKSNLELLDTLRIEQTHLPLKEDTWVVKSQVLYPTANIVGFDISGHFITVYDKQRVNEPMPDSIFNTKITSTYDKEANKRDTSYWTSFRPIPLEADESRNYVFKDSVRILKESPEYRDSMRRRGNKFDPTSLIVGGYTYASKGYKNTYSINSILTGMVNYNTVEGVNIAPRIGWVHKVDTVQKIVGTVALRYGFANTHFNGIGRFHYQENAKDVRGKYWRIGIQGGKYVFQYNPVSTLTPLYNTISTLAWGKNYLKLYERWDGAAFFEKEYGNGFTWSATARFQRRLPLANSSKYTFRKRNEDKLTSNYPAELSWQKWEEHNAASIQLTASYQPGYTYTQYPDFISPNGSDMPVFTLSYQKAIPGIANSKTDFDKWRFSIKDDLPLKLLGSISYDIAAGGFLTKKYVSLPDLMHLSDNQLTLAAPYLSSFQLAPYYKYSNAADIYAEAHIEYYMKGLLTNKIPLLRQAKWYLVVGTNTFYAGQSNYYTEAFAGVTNLGYKMYRVLRVDFIQGWDNMKNSYTGIRVGLDLSTLGGNGSILGGAKEEW